MTAVPNEPTAKETMSARATRAKLAASEAFTTRPFRLCMTRSHTPAATLPMTAATTSSPMRLRYWPSLLLEPVWPTCSC